MAGAYDVVIATGVGCMTRVPIGSSIGTNVGFPFGPGVLARYAPGGGLVTQGIAAEMVADRWDLSREDLDAYGARSQHRAAAANAEGRFESELIPVAVKDGEGNETGEILRTDEGIRPGTTIEALAAPKPVFKPDVGKVTAGNSSQITDGASAVLVTSEETALRLGLTPRARLVEFAVVGVDSVTMLTGPIPATTRVLERAGIALSDIDLVEINEAFASVVLAWAKEHHPDLDRVNVNGGAIASGHPLGASGARLMATLLCELERSGGRYGLQTMCEGGGLANATIIERLT
jgi:acetyl-CoA acyltransferase